MITHIIGILVLALTYGAFWHMQPARRQKDEKHHDASLLGRLANRALEWLVLMPHISTSAESEAPFLISEQSAMPEGQIEFIRPVLPDVRGCNPEHRITVARAAAAPSVTGALFKIEGKHA